jgi:hypothetical protein
MRIIKWPKWYLLLCVIGGVIFFIYYFESPNDVRERKFQQDISNEINCVLVKKYIDFKNHKVETCAYLRNGDTVTFYLHFDKSGLFNYLNEGDSIKKARGDSCVNVIRGNSCKEFILKY